MRKVSKGDLVFFKSGETGIISKIFNNYFGDNEDIYEVRYLNNRISFNRFKDFSRFI